MSIEGLKKELRYEKPEIVYFSNLVESEANCPGGNGDVSSGRCGGGNGHTGPGHPTDCGGGNGAINSCGGGNGHS